MSNVVELKFSTPNVISINRRGNRLQAMMDWKDGCGSVPLIVERHGSTYWWCDADAPQPRRPFTDLNYMFWEFNAPKALQDAIKLL